MKTAIDNYRQTRDTTMKAVIIPEEKADENKKVGKDVGIFV